MTTQNQFETLIGTLTIESTGEGEVAPLITRRLLKQLIKDDRGLATKSVLTSGLFNEKVGAPEIDFTEQRA